MFRILVVTVFIFTSSIIGYRQENIGELRFVVVLYRHGDRTPTKTYSKDPYNNISRYWPDGLGELTNLGVQHQYELGKWFRNRYVNFLPETYSPTDIYVRSSDRDRTLMSAAANLAGLYPPKGPQIWNQNLPWRPVPIHTVPNQDDEVVAMKKRCPKYDSLYEQLLNSDLFQHLNDRNRELYNTLSENTGWNITEIRQIETLYSILSIEEEYNLTLPAWTSGIFPDKLKFLAALSHASFSFTRKLARLKTGPFFDYVFTHFNDVISNSSSLKFLMISAHDNTIVNILCAMGIYDFSCPDFASSIIWELKETEGKFYINLFYRNNGTITQLKIPNCEIDCDFSIFKSSLEHVTVNKEDWSKECIV